MARRLGHSFIVPNFCGYGHEADLISVTRTNYVHEYEIKISKADFRDELRQAAMDDLGYRSSHKWRKHNAMKHPASTRRRKPNYFTFVAPPDVIDYDDVPEYAGLIYYLHNERGRACLETIKRPPLLHKDTMPPDLVRRIAISLEYRYWNVQHERLKS